MLFNSYIFVFLFFPLVVSGYYVLHRIGWGKAALGFLIMMSLIFYGYNNVSYLAILVVSIILNYLLVLVMNKADGPVGRLLFLIIGVLLNLGILFYFKYYDFFIENVNTALKADYHFLGLELPLGISFYTFQQLSYVIDSYKGDCDKYSFIEYAAYVSFFPQLIAGPIVYHDELIPQLRAEENHHIHYENFSKGIYAFALGMAKKVLVADTMSKVVTVGFAHVNELNSISALLVMICYSIQIYFDFSGYCDMAYGIGFMFNVELPLNFNSPYKAASVKELWDRWHMTLTRFFTKYVYIPLGGSRKGKARTYLNIMIVFLVSGIWHGANWTFMVWGILNGAGILFDRLCGKILNRIPRIIRRVTTYCFFTGTLILFRAESLRQAWQMFSNFFVMGDGRGYADGAVYAPITSAFNELTEMRLLYRMGFGGMIESYPWMGLALFTLLILLSCFFMRNTQEKVQDMQYTASRMAAVTGLMIWSILSFSDVSEFLYFNF